MPSLYAFVPSPAHEYADHPECPGRLTELEARLREFRAERIDPAPATRAEIARVHSTRLIRDLESAGREGP